MSVFETSAAAANATALSTDGCEIATNPIFGSDDIRNFDSVFAQNSHLSLTGSLS